MCNNNKKPRSKQFETTVVIEDIRRLQMFMGQELSLYNRINTELTRLLRRDHKMLSALSDAEINTFAKIVGENFKIGSIRNRKQFDLPDALETHRETITSINGMTSTLLENMTGPEGVIKSVRERMAFEMLHFYRNSAIAKDKGAYEFLESLDNARKRHIQVPRFAVQMAYNESTDTTTVKTPYNTAPMKVKGDVTKLTGWEVLIVHQKPGKLPTVKTPWQLDFRVPEKNETYLLKYMEMMNPYGGSANHQSARSGRCVQF